MMTMTLITASRKGQNEEVKKLLQTGQDVEQKDQNGETGLTWAAFNGHGKCLNTLLENGCWWWNESEYDRNYIR